VTRASSSRRSTGGLSEADYAARQAAAEAEGLRVTVGALVVDGAGRVFVHRRGWNRRLFPGSWDIIGGHAEPGETLLEALAREVAEETGWRMVGTPALVHVGEWEGRREFDFLIEVEGDLDNPRLEVPAHIDYRWVEPSELLSLDESGYVDEGLIGRLVQLIGRRNSPGA
jgi:8-oxo-dGTP diphosphatase